jgi:cellulose synthase/poly-beta-1,6-N-acetylglucosamine synthase-like glycosyltransferase
MTFVLNLLAAPFAAWWGLWAALAAAARRPRRDILDGGVRRIDVVVPAHDEETRVGALVASLRSQDAPDLLGRVLVVADHCNDRTADVARAAGAEVLVRDSGAPGKPPALRDGLAQLRAAAGRGEAVVLLDADCECDPGFLRALAARTGPDDQVVQAAYTLEEPDRGAVRGGLELGFALRNVVRAQGADNLGLPLVLFGSGMLFRWDALEHLSFGDPRLDGTGDSRPVADDVLMALDLVAAGIHPRFAGGARVVAPTPEDDHALGAQRLRWEGGQALMWQRMPSTARALLARRDWRGLVALVDWTAPPLAPSVLAVAGIGVVGVGAVAAGAATPVVLVVPAAAGGFLAAYLVLGVSELQGRAGVTRLVAGAPRFLAWKAGLYLRHRTARRVVS